MKIYTKNDLIDLVQSLKDYTHESHSILGHDERDAQEFVDIFLKDRTPNQLPSDEEIVEMGKDFIIYNDTKRGWFIQGLKFMRDKIQGGE